MLVLPKGMNGKKKIKYAQITNKKSKNKLISFNSKKYEISVDKSIRRDKI